MKYVNFITKVHTYTHKYTHNGIALPLLHMHALGKNCSSCHYSSSYASGHRNQDACVTSIVPHKHSIKLGAGRQHKCTLDYFMQLPVSKFTQ